MLNPEWVILLIVFLYIDFSQWKAELLQCTQAHTLTIPQTPQASAAKILMNKGR